MGAPESRQQSTTACVVIQGTENKHTARIRNAEGGEKREERGGRREATASANEAKHEAAAAAANSQNVNNVGS